MKPLHSQYIRSNGTNVMLMIKDTEPPPPPTHNFKSKATVIGGCHSKMSGTLGSIHTQTTTRGGKNLLNLQVVDRTTALTVTKAIINFIVWWSTERGWRRRIVYICRSIMFMGDECAHRQQHHHRHRFWGHAVKWKLYRRGTRPTTRGVSPTQSLFPNEHHRRRRPPTTESASNISASIWPSIFVCISFVSAVKLPLLCANISFGNGVVGADSNRGQRTNGCRSPGAAPIFMMNMCTCNVYKCRQLGSSNANWVR